MSDKKRERLSGAPQIVMFCVSLLVVCAIALLSYRNIEAAKQASDQGKTAQSVRDASKDLLSMLKDAETGQRGYLLTGKEPYLEPYHNAVSGIPDLLKQLDAQAAQTPEQAARVRKLQPLVLAKLAELQNTVELRRANKQAEALLIVDTSRGKRLMDEIRMHGAAIEQSMDARLEEFAAAENESSDRLRVVSTFGGALLFAFVIISAVVNFRGMSRREALYKEAEAAKKLFATTLVDIADAVIVTDAGGIVTFINPVAQKLTGWKGQEALGRHIGEIFAIVNETTQIKIDNPLEKALAEGVTVGLANHANLISRDGRQCPIDDSAAPLKDEYGNLIGTVLVFRDISARRHSERQLETASAALRRSNEELQHFVSAAAHDLRSPLNSVSVVTQLLSRKLEKQLDGKDKELIGYITDSVSRVVRLLEALLSFARASHFDVAAAGRLPLDGVLKAVLDDLSVEIANADATVTSDPLPVVEAHETHMLQLFQNLIGNALKYRGQHPPRIHVSVKRRDAQWVIGVTDNGIGIDPSYATQIFQPFKRLHGEEYPGSGIGLATCQKIVAGYGGNIWVESEPGCGSKFFFTLAVADAQDAAAMTASSKEQFETTA
ncbi:PAS domain S-box-containing protein [Nitrosospira sp. Nl5]|uniref:sensor histidine kinase n=1 Tax=Nitrosospira sp. Nl5 TaxID=200120 RepID=UPI0008865406|nr:sensor histidine kinase [Nitrosospira sp. Nl5]SCY49416.1 PAS domain S-box-containing protein [Nitrosospira sp. Nl5]